MKSVNPPGVLILTQCLGMGGLEKTLVHLATGLRREGFFTPFIYAYDQDPETTPWRSEIEKSNVAWHASVKLPGFSWAVVKNLRAFIRDHGIEIIHTHDLNALIYGALVKWSGSRVSIVHTQHTFLHLHLLKHRIFESIFPRAADVIVCPSESLRAVYGKRGFPDTRLIPNGIDVPLQPLAPTDRRAWLEGGPRGGEDAVAFGRLKADPAERWVLVLARVQRGKGQENILKIWPRLSPEFRRNSRIIMVGPANEASYIAELRTMCSRLPGHERIVWMGPSSRPQEWMGVSDVFVSLSDFEGMPLAPVEASLSGSPLVLSDIPGHRGMEVPATQWVAVHDAPQFESAVVGATRPTEEELRPIRKTYSLDSMVRAYQEIYSSFGKNL